MYRSAHVRVRGGRVACGFLNSRTSVASSQLSRGGAALWLERDQGPSTKLGSGDAESSVTLELGPGREVTESASPDPNLVLGP